MLACTPVADNAYQLVPSDRPGMPVHLYEVARLHNPYELTLFDSETDPVGSENPRRCPGPWLTRGRVPWLLPVIVVLVGLLFYPASSSWQRFLGWTFGRARTADQPIWRYRLINLAVAVELVLGCLIYWAHIRDGEESFELFEGISVWPTVVLRLLASGLCVYYIAKACEDLNKRNEGLCRDSPSARPGQITAAHDGDASAPVGPPCAGVAGRGLRARCVERA